MLRSCCRPLNPSGGKDGGWWSAVMSFLRHSGRLVHGTEVGREVGRWVGGVLAEVWRERLGLLEIC